ncbi:TetR/AcrR family transcriptional regulator [Nocardia asteroides]|uniref:TetR/AcrR family transcriptional regulator n=1 Tax=Nocardia asteroides TaxID=1824 RepID=UPI001E3C7B58|nr:TetR/AcrR family transcriptional regulator [Nocardia asteroides]UGT59063.1 TetR/AcrR family transcriptional regulator [Nocardia asteroides]
MAGGTKRLPRAVREQQMLDAAVEVFSRKGFHDTSMDAIAAEAKISKPMLYLYYGSKDELFRACIQREGLRFIESVAPAGNPHLTPHEQLRTALEGFLGFVDSNRKSWQVLYRQAIGQETFASEIENARERVIELTAKLLESSARYADPSTNFDIVAAAVIGAGEAIADRVAGGRIEVAEAVALLDDLAWRGLAGRKKSE